jgi:hypothetical protein
VPLASMPRSIDDVHQLTENYSSDPALFRGYGADFNATAYPFYPAPRPPLRTGQTSAWFFGESLGLDSATLVLAQGASPGTLVRLGTLSADGSTHWGSMLPVATGATSVTGRIPSGAAVGLSVQVIGSLPAQRAVITTGGRPYELGGSLSSALVPGPWQQAGFAQGYAVFTLRAPPVPISASTTTGRPLPVAVVSSATKSEEIRVNAPAAATVIRSVAWDSGWSATVSVNGGRAENIPVGSFDLVQRVRIPAGNDLVTFRYRPPHFLVASVLSLGAIALLAALLIVWLVRRRRPVYGQLSPARPEVASTEAPEVPEHVG